MVTNRVVRKRKLRLREVVLGIVLWCCVVFGWARVLPQSSVPEIWFSIRFIATVAAIYGIGVGIWVWWCIRLARRTLRLSNERILAIPASREPVRSAGD